MGFFRTAAIWHLIMTIFMYTSKSMVITQKIILGSSSSVLNFSTRDFLIKRFSTSNGITLLVVFSFFLILYLFKSAAFYIFKLIFYDFLMKYTCKGFYNLLEKAN